jgi:hypothetical protein
MQFMLKALRRHPLLVGTADVLADVVRYVAIMLVVLLLLGQFAKVALGSSMNDQLRSAWTK